MSRKRKKRILMLLENCSMPEDTRVRNEALALVEHGFEVSVVSPNIENNRTYENFEGIHLYRYPAPFEFGGVLGYAWEFGYSALMAWLFSCYLLFRRGFDAIHVHSPPDMNCVVAIFFKLFAFKKYVLDTHDLSPELYAAQKGGKSGGLVNALLLWFERRAVRWADGLIATNETQRSIQIERAGAVPENCYVVRNGPAESFVALADPSPNVVAEERSVIGYVGIIGVQDGVDMLIKALDHLRNEIQREDFLGVIVGDGPALPMLKDLVQELKMDSFIQFTGMVPYEDVPRYISAFDICATPDPSNPYNDSCTTIKTMEYMVQARPVVAFETPENCITAKDAALYAKDNSIAGMARLIVQLMDSPDQRQVMGAIGRKRMLDKLIWRHQEKELVRLYSELFHLQQSSLPASKQSKTEVAQEQVQSPPLSAPSQSSRVDASVE